MGLAAQLLYNKMQQKQSGKRTGEEEIISCKIVGGF